jgi:acetyl esterase/lipase
MTKHLALLLIVIGSTANAQTTLDHSKVIPPAPMTFAEFPESRSFTTGITVIPSDFSDPAVGLSLNVEYATKSGMPLHVNVMTPWPFDDGAAARRLPLIVFVQGSAWLKQEIHNLPQLVAMVKKGYIVAVVEYRPSMVAPFPAQIADTKSAIRFLKKNADRFNIDASRVVLWGDSSGGHTVLMTAVTLDRNLYDDEGQDKDPISLKAVIDYYGPTDISKMNMEPSTWDHMSAKSPEGLFIGGLDVLQNPGQVEPTIPMRYLSKGQRLPPIFIAHGSKDRLVAFGQSVMMYDALKTFGKEATMYQLKGADHGGTPFWSRDMLNFVDAFIREHL